MSYLLGLTCLRCNTEYPVGRMFQGCPRCTGDQCSNLTTGYDYERIAATTSRDTITTRPHTMWRYREFLPVDPEHIVSIHEGWTPLIHCQRLGAQLGLKHLYVKEESRNATWSFKDRMASSAVSMAVAMGAEVIVTSSSGNGGAATAAYAAKAGLPCVIFTTTQFPGAMRTQMQVYGPMLFTTPTARDRWEMTARCVNDLGWYPIQNFVEPPVGANPYGIDGYKTIGHEVCEQLGWRTPDVFVVPVASGDAFVGPWIGFNELLNLDWATGPKPRMIAAEVFGPLKQALASGWDHVEKVAGGKTVSVSVGGTNSAYQALKTVWDSQGLAETATDDEVMAMQMALARAEGIYAEASSVLTLAVVKKLRERGEVGADDTVVALLTGSGLKDPEVSVDYLPSIPAITPTLEDLERGLWEHYGYRPRRFAARTGGNE
jgi:threonine synthase